MAAVVVGSRLGLEQTSGWVLGGRGQLGGAAVGRAGENVFVNAATGNLVVTRQDEFLAGLGPDAAISRTYNSLGQMDDDNGDNWRASVSRSVSAVWINPQTGANAVTRTDWDGSQVVYDWNAATGRYQTAEGGGAYDSLSLAGGVWTWTDGDSQVRERYDAQTGRLLDSTDINGNTLTFSYSAQGLVSRVTTADGSYTDLVYGGPNGRTLMQVSTTYRDVRDNQLKTATRVRYAYDALDRLSAVTVDLSPGDNAVSDGAAYVTRYTYDGDSRRLASISQSDGSRVDVTYVQVGGVYRVSSLAQAVQAGVSRVTSFAYEVNGQAGRTIVTDAEGGQTTLVYSQGRLTSVVAPGATAGASRTTTYTYNDRDDVIRVDTAPGEFVVYEYADNGLWSMRRNGAGEVTTRVFNTDNTVKTETTYKVADSDGAGPAQASGGMTARYVYDAAGRLAYAITAEGRVSAYTYDAQGRQTSVRVFLNDKLDLSAYGATETPVLADLDALAPLVDQTTVQRTDMTYDFRGHLLSVTEFGRVLSSGEGDAAGPLTRTHYVYDQSGALLSRRIEGVAGAETYLRDGLGRVISAVDFNGGVTRTAFLDAAATTVVTLADGLNQVSTFNLAGERIAYQETRRASDLLNTPGWPTPSTVTQGAPASVPGWDNSLSGEGAWKVVDGPNGRPIVVIEAGQSDGGEQGGGAITAPITIDPSQAYEFVFYFRKIDLTRQGVYFGLEANWGTGAPDVEYASGYGSEVNPYFFGAQAQDLQNLSDDRWYKVVAHVLPAGSADVPRGTYGGVYDVETGDKVAVATTFRWSADRADNEVRLRFFTYYDENLPGPSTYFAKPEVRIIDLASPNLIDTSQWPTGPDVPAGPAHPANWTLPTGWSDEDSAYVASETRWRLMDGPDGQPIVVMEGGQNGDGENGGGGLTNLVQIDGQSVYRYEQYFRKSDLSKHWLGFGLGRDWETPYVQDAATGEPESNPYFWVADTGTQAAVLEADRWYKIVGYVLPEGVSADTVAGLAGVFDAVTGEQVAETTVFRWDPARPAESIYTRFFTFYDETLTGFTTQFGQPDFRKTDLGKLAAEAVSGPTTQYRYDGLGRVRQIIDPTGASRHMLYDTAGRLVAEVDGDGSVIEYRYDAADRQIAVVGWAERLSAAGRAALTDGLGNPAAVSLADLRPEASADDAWAWTVYDAAGRIVQTIDAEGTVTVNKWDGAGRLVETRAHAAQIDLTALRETPPAAPVAVTTTAGKDRVTRIFYDADGLRIGTLDAAGFLTRIAYDNAGRAIQTTAFATAVPAASRETASFSALIAAMPQTAGDIHSWSVYDRRGFVVGTVNGEGDVVLLQRDALGQVTVESRGRRMAALPTTPPEYWMLTAAPAGVVDDTVFVRDAYGRVLQETRSLAVGGEVTSYAYDALGRLLRQTVTPVAGPARAVQLRYDALGRLTGRLTGEGAAVLFALGANASTAQIDAVYDQYGVVQTYDEAGRLIAVTEAGRRTIYYYDADGRLTVSINAEGEVIENHYDAFGRLTRTTAYANRVMVDGLEGGSNPPLLLVSYDDRITLSQYTRTGEVESVSYAGGGGADYAYNAFGELVGQSEAYGLDLVRRVQYDRDQRGLVTSTRVYGQGDERTEHVVRDAFGRATQTIDGRGLSRSTTYDRAGRIVVSTDATGATTHFAYDARGNRVSMTDASGDVTTYAYDAFNRKVTITAPLGLVTSTRFNDAGQEVSFSDADGRETTYTYDRDGRLTATTNPAGEALVRAYDAGGQLFETIDAAGLRVRYTYDAAGRVLSRRTDPDGLNLTETFAYNAFGDQIETIDASGRTTIVAFDQAGRRTEVTVDPDGLALRTVYAYDLVGRVVSRVEAVGTDAERETRYEYDVLDRLVWSETGDAALNVRSRYVYDGAGNVTERRDAISAEVEAVTRYVYDAENRLTWTIDATGAVSRNEYDVEGRLIRASAYAVVLTAGQMDQLGSAPTNAQLSALALGQAQTTRYAYDAAGRLTFRIAADNVVTAFGHDGAGNVVRETVYARLLDQTDTSHTAFAARLSQADFAEDTRNRVTSQINDAAGRRLYSVDSLGHTTAYVYAGGRLIRTVEYAAAYGGDRSATALDFWTLTAASSADRKTHFAYDAAGRRTFAVDAAGYVTRAAYDAAGNLLSATRYSQPVSVSNGADEASLNAAVAGQTAGALTTRYAYDGAGRATFVVDAEGYVSGSTYDGLGNLLSSTRYEDRVTVSDGVSPAALEVAVAAQSGTARTTRYAYDGAGRATFSVDAEGYVARSTYDGLGNLLSASRFAERPSLADLSHAGLSAATAAQGGAVVTTSYTYDEAGRLTRQTAASGVSTVFEHDAWGRVVRERVAAGTGDESVTYREYDAAGRMTLERRGEGTPASTTSTWSYDALGNAVSVTDGRGSTSVRTFDVLGRMLTETVPLADGVQATTTRQYDAFGNLAKLTDPRGASGHFYYDALNRLVLQVDPEGYATETAYGAGTEALSVTRRIARTTGTAGVGVRPTVTTSAADATTVFQRDKLERLVGQVDAEGFAETYDLNAFGDRTAVTNRLGGRTTYVHDKRGLKLSETLPITSTAPDGTVRATSVTHTFAYDSRGNLTSQVEASGLAEARTTIYAYDALDRLISKTGDAVMLPGERLAFDVSVTPVERYAYDTRGNLIEMIDAAGARTLSYYDALNRRTAQVNAVGSLSTWRYDAAGNVVAERTYGTAVTLPAAAGGQPPATPAGEYRETLRTYDRNNRQISVEIVGVRTAAMGYFTQAVAAGSGVVETTTYDAAGNVVREVDGRGANVYHFYDQLGRRTATVDGEGYLTTFQLDAEGNTVLEERFANRPTGPISATSDVAALRAEVAGDANDRLTRFEYDRNGRRSVEERLGVTAYILSGNGALIQTSSSALIYYGYDGLGNVVLKREANGDSTEYVYDLAGRQTAVKGAHFVNDGGGQDQNRVQLFYDGLGNLTRTREGHAVAEQDYDRITTYTYGAGGRLASTTDASGFVRSFGYDAAGRLVRETFLLRQGTNSDLYQRGVFTHYDALGRVVETYNAGYQQTDAEWLSESRRQTQYNAYGDVTAVGMNGGWQETFQYDAAGRIWRSTSEDGTVKLYVTDGAGAITASIASAGADLSGYSYAQLHDVLIGQNMAATTLSMALTWTLYDARGQAVATREPNRQADRGQGTVAGEISTSRVYNAFGEVDHEFDARGAATNYTYNTMGRLTSKVLPGASVTLDNGGYSSERPTELYAYDLSGRLIGTRDANGTWTTRKLLEGSGHGGAEATVQTEFRVDGRTQYGINVFGDTVHEIDALGQIKQFGYDQMGRLTSYFHGDRPAGSPGSADGWEGGLTDYFAYDGLGRQIQHWNSMYGTGAVEKTDYDMEGRIFRHADFGGAITDYRYLWVSTLQTNGLGTFGGWEKTTYFAQKNSVERTDYFGRSLSTLDYGGYHTTSIYDLAGRLTSRGNGLDLLVQYQYFNTGALASVIDRAPNLALPNARDTTNTYTYDVLGNAVRENVKVDYYSSYWDPETEHRYYYVASTEQLRAVAATYDNLGRITYLSDSAGNGGANPISIAYEYDANGNVRRALTTYRAFGSSTDIVQDHWYKYDALNRFVTVKGTFVGQRGSGSIVRGQSGVDLTYDAAGNRKTATTTMMVDKEVGGSWYYDEWDNPYYQAYYEQVAADRVEYYNYSTDGYLATVYAAESYWNTASSSMQLGAAVLKGENRYDSMGREVAHWEYRADGSVFSRSTDYDARSNVTADRTWITQGQRQEINSNTYEYALYGVYQGGGVVSASNLRQVLLNGQTAEREKISTTSYDYEWRASARQKTITFEYDVTETGTVSQTNFTYRSSGALAQIQVADGRPRTVNFKTDANGQVIDRSEASSASLNPRTLYYYFGDVRIGEIGNDGAGDGDYVSAIATRAKAAQTGPFRNNTQVAYGDFDQAYQPITPDQPGRTGSQITIQDGDTLQSIAAAVWGDASLWYMIADANGLSGSTPLVAGMTLVVPNKVFNKHNTSETFRVYDPNSTIGNISPTTVKARQVAPPPAKKGGCGVVGQIIAVVIAVAVSVATYGALTGAAAGAVSATTAIGAGAVAGAAGSVASQAFLMATGAQDQFNWKGVGIAALSGGIGGGLSKATGIFQAVNGSRIAGDVIRSATANALTQGVAVATGLQSKFDWTGVAVAGVAGGAFAEVSRSVEGWAPKGGWVNNALSGSASAFASAGARSLIDGSSFGDNILAALPDVVGQTIGSVVGARLLSSARSPRVGGAPNAPAEELSEGGKPQGYAVGGPVEALIEPGGEFVIAPDGTRIPIRGGAVESNRNGIPDGFELIGRYADPDTVRVVGGEIVELLGSGNRVYFANNTGHEVYRGQAAVGESVYDIFYDRDAGTLLGSTRAQNGAGVATLADGRFSVDYGSGFTAEDIVVTAERRWTAGRVTHEVLNYIGLGAMGVLNGAVVQPGLATAQLGGSAVSMVWDYGTSIFSSDPVARFAAGERNASRIGGAVSTARGIGSLGVRLATDGSYRSQLVGDYWSERIGVGGPMGLFNATTDVTGLGTAFIPGSQAGRVGQASRIADSLNGVADVATLTRAAETTAGRGAYFFDQQALPYINRADATLGQTGQAHFFMPLEDSSVVTDAASAYRYTGGAPSLERAYTAGGEVYGVEFPLDGLSPRLPTAADTTLPHFLEGGNTALRLPNGGGYLVNPTREFVVPGGGSMPSGSTLFKIGPNGTRIPIRGWQ